MRSEKQSSKCESLLHLKITYMHSQETSRVQEDTSRYWESVKINYSSNELQTWRVFLISVMKFIKSVDMPTPHPGPMISPILLIEVGEPILQVMLIFLIWRQPNEIARFGSILVSEMKKNGARSETLTWRKMWQLSRDPPNLMNAWF